MRKEQSKADPTAAARSPIRRQQRPPYARRRTPPRREPSSNFPPSFQRSPPPSSGFNGMREGRQSENRIVPPVATLLESADRRTTESRSTAELRAVANARAAELQERERELRASIAELQTVSVQLQDQRNRIDSPAQQRSPRRNADRPRPTLPTPPHDESGDQDSLFVPDTSFSRRRLHPLSNSWRPESPINGLGDRIRSPTPGDGWEVMRTTIAPDEHLPSADSSFTSAAVAQSFNSGTTTTADTDSSSSSANSRHTSQEGQRSESVSSVDPDDLVCTDENRDAEAEFAAALYNQEQMSLEGQDRIATIVRAYHEEGQRRFADYDESEPVEIGFRLMYDAFETEAGRQRLEQLAEHLNAQADVADLAQRAISRRWDNSRRDRPAEIDDDSPPSPRPDQYSENTRAAVRQASEQVHDYFRRFTADSLTAGTTSRDRATSPPPRYEPLASHPHVDTFISRDAPEAHPVSPPSARSERDIGDALLSGNETDLEPMRRIVERLAARDDVPDEWWMSMGLNLSRARVQSRSPPRNLSTDRDRVRTGLIDRGDSDTLRSIWMSRPNND